MGEILRQKKEDNYSERRRRKKFTYLELEGEFEENLKAD